VSANTAGLHSIMFHLPFIASNKCLKNFFALAVIAGVFGFEVGRGIALTCLAGFLNFPQRKVNEVTAIVFATTNIKRHLDALASLIVVQQINFIHRCLNRDVLWIFTFGSDDEFAFGKPFVEGLRFANEFDAACHFVSHDE
jgi:hypothetical protein